MHVVQRPIDPEAIFGLMRLEEQIHFLLRFAIIAPSTHNSQPWRFTVGDRSCQLHYDPTKRLLEADPYMRDMYISLGCALENLEIAARYASLHQKTVYHMRDTLVAEVFFSGEPRRHADPHIQLLCHAMSSRHNARGEYTAKKIDDDFLKQCKDIARSYQDYGIRVRMLNHPEEIRKIAEHTATGVRVARAQPAFRKEFARWFRHNLTQRKDGIPGFAVGLPLVPSVIAPVVLRFFACQKLLAKKNYDSIITAPAVCVIESDNETPEVWVRAGQLAERLMLACYAKGLATSVYVAAIEMDTVLPKLIEDIGLSGRPQFLFTFGFTDVRPKRLTPRLPLSAVLTP